MFHSPRGFNTLWPRRNGRHFADDTFKRIFLNENARISIKFSLKFVPNGQINNIPALVQIMAWRRSGDKPLSEPMMVSLPTHICVTRLQWFNTSHTDSSVVSCCFYFFMVTWWRHQMETFSALLAICLGNWPVTGEFPAQRPVTRSFDVFFDPRLNKRLSKQWWGWWDAIAPIMTSL